MRLPALWLVIASSAAFADSAVSLEPGVTLAVSQPQASYFGVGAGGLLTGHLGVASFFDLQLQGGLVWLPARAGAPVSGAASAVLAGLGFRLHLPADYRVVPWLDADAHYVNTGGLSRFALTVGAGALIRLTPEGTVFVGPTARLVQFFKLVDEANFSNFDATLLSFGATLLIRFGDGAARADTDSDGDGVPDSKDGCPHAPGPAPSGCPSKDADGDLVPDVSDACPNVAGLALFAGCPDPDPDRDGVQGTADLCPAVAEDRDGFKDDDGCPEPDNDGDSVLDGNDLCPLVAGPAATRGCPDGDGDGVADPQDECPTAAAPGTRNGCPEYKQVFVTESKLEIRQKILFAFGKADILPKSFGLMDEVTRAATDHVRLCLRIEGHTDAVGSAAKNKQLSADRARAVAAYLVSHGIDARRLSSEGYGAEQPLETNATPEGRERNRRVEFVIVPCAQ